MRILGISLLRLGDLILQRPLVVSLRENNPNAQIHLLINKQFSQVEFLFEGIVDRFIYFDRDLFQQSCGEPEFNIFWGLERLKDLISDLNRNCYDQVYNLTHNRLTAHIAGLIRSEKHTGIYTRSGHFFGLNNPWIQFFNSYFGKPEALGFHYTELLAKALGISLKAPQRNRQRRNTSFRVMMQPLTSDRKKNWSLEKYQALKDRIEKETPYKVVVIGAPYEEQVLVKYFSKDSLLICSLREASEHLKSADLLITGDTSIKHLAALYSTPILELALGSSLPWQVGAYADDSIILQPRVSCGPCPPSLPCSQNSQRCEEKISVEAVYGATQIVLGLSQMDWRLFAYKNSGLSVFRTRITHELGWAIESMSIDQNEQHGEFLQRKMMIVQELDRRIFLLNKGGADEQRTRELSDSGAEAP
ncbi:MAG: glycosyltransferase family 9 protein [Bdellovibrionaceae bacterium]|nr:glycosyltransferase family 9 protein [Pseudobdellovibrionaceae bacterium]